jgi:tripartite-type tricarboxylate transporter receptor subunit TctC
MRRVAASLAICTTLLMAFGAFAQDWPTRPITLVVPLAAGGGSDGLIRVFAPRLSELLGQSVIVENVGGAGGMIGSARVAKAAPDGYQILLGTQGTHALNQAIYAKPSYDAVRDFEPVALVFDVPLVLMGRKGLPANDIKEFAAYARMNAATMQYGSSGAGGNGHLACRLVNSAIGVDITHVPYRGGGPAMADLLAGRLDYICALANIAKPQIDAGEAKGLAMLSPERSPILPDVPTGKEQGLADVESVAWNAIFLPKGTPAPIVDKLHRAVFAALDTPMVRDRLIELGASMVPPERRSPAYLRQFVETEIAKWAATVKAAGITPLLPN